MATPSGYLTLYNGSSTMASLSLDAGGNFTWSHTFNPGTYAISAHYAGDANFNAAVSDTVYLVVNAQGKQNVVFNFSVNPNPAQSTDSVTVAGTVSAA